MIMVAEPRRLMTCVEMAVWCIACQYGNGLSSMDGLGKGTEKGRDIKEAALAYTKNTRLKKG